MELIFRDTEVGFYLTSCTFNRERFQEYNTDLAGYIGYDVFIDRDDNIVLYELVFKNTCNEIDNWIDEVQDLYKSDSLYSVREFNLFNVPFDEVLRRVKNYYQLKHNEIPQTVTV